MRYAGLVLTIGIGSLLAVPASAGNVAGANQTTSYRALLEKHAPVFVQEIGQRPLYDVMTGVDFDGDHSGYDNVANARRYPLPAQIYGDVVAETEDSYYLFYGVYHVRDYDSTLREFFFPSASHDNDFEGLMMVVDKATGSIPAIETWFHSRFLQFANAPDLGRSQTIDGKIHLEDGTHPMILVQALGHGVRCLQKIDEEKLARTPHAIYRLGAAATEMASLKGPFAAYELRTMDDFFRFAKGPFDPQSLLAEPQDFGLGTAPIGKYISGNFKGDSSWARPKPPWSWADKFDTLRPGAWFFHPAHVFNRHFQLKLSEDYLYNRPLEEIVQGTQEELDVWVLEKAPSYFNGASKGMFHRPLKSLKKKLYRLSEYLFYVFG